MCKISAIVLTYNSVRYIEKCIDSLLETLPKIGKNSEIFIVDNGSGDGTLDVIESYRSRYPEQIKTILFNENRGTTYSRNAALKQATGEYILILDSDAYVNNVAVESLVKLLKTHPKWGIICPKLTYSSGRFQISVDQFPTLLRKAKRFLFLKGMEDKSSPYDYKLRMPVDYAISAFWLFRRELLDEVGYLDEDIFYSPEDVDFCLRVWESGYQVIYEPSVSIVHDAQEISRGFKLNKFVFSHIFGLLYLFRKHRYGFGLRKIYKRLRREKNAELALPRSGI